MPELTSYKILSQGVCAQLSAQTLHRSQKSLGAFYTPPELARIMANWAIRSRNEKILEPSFGGCCFVNESWDRLRQLGNPAPFKNLYGADIDIKAFSHLRERFPTQIFDRKFINGDYLYLGFDAFATQKFEVIIGNPPYIGYSSQTLKQRALYRSKLNEIGIKLKGRPSVWAHFVIASLARLKTEGRMAWVLPWAFLTAEYASQLRSILRKHFHYLAIFAIEEDLFLSEGTKERSVIVLADIFSDTTTKSNEKIFFCSDLADFKDQLLSYTSNRSSEKSSNTLCVRKKAENNLKQSHLSSQLSLLEDHGKLGIGVVTGDINTFLLQKKMISRLHLLKNQTQRCLVRPKYVPGITVSEEDFDHFDKAGIPTRLLTLPPNTPISNQVKHYLKSKLSSDDIIKNKTFKKRPIWYSIPKQLPPDGIITFFTSRSPRFIINNCNTAATNSNYCFWLTDSTNQEKKNNILASIALSMISGLGRTYSELYSNRFGNSAIKVNISALKKMPVFIAKQDNYYDTIQAMKLADMALRHSNYEKSIEIANHWLEKMSGSHQTVQEIEQSARCMFMARTRNNCADKDN